MSQPIRIKDHEKDARLVRGRVVFGAIAVVCLIGVLIARLYFLQVIQYEYHSTLSENNRVHVQPIPPTRGLIFDRNGVVIADNRPSFSLSMTRERSGDWQQVLDVIVEVLQLTPEDRVIFEKRMRQGRRPFEPVPILFELTEEQIARIAVNQFRLPGWKSSRNWCVTTRRGRILRTRWGTWGGSTRKNSRLWIRWVTAAPIKSAKPASSASTSRSCTVRWVTKKSRPTPEAVCCGCSSVPTRFPARTLS